MEHRVPHSDTVPADLSYVILGHLGPRQPTNTPLGRMLSFKSSYGEGES